MPPVSRIALTVLSSSWRWRATNTTFAPAFASCLPSASPNPRLPPVMSTDVLLTFILMCLDGEYAFFPTIIHLHCQFIVRRLSSWHEPADRNEPRKQHSSVARRTANDTRTDVAGCGYSSRHLVQSGVGGIEPYTRRIDSRCKCAPGAFGGINRPGTAECEALSSRQPAVTAARQGTGPQH